MRRLLIVVLASCGAAAASSLGPAASVGASSTSGACAPGAHTLAAPGSHLYPETGNGGYTSVHTLVHLVYDSRANRFLRGNHVVLTDRATRCLTSFSLDFERHATANPNQGPDMSVVSVRVNGHPARFRFVKPTYPGDPNGQDDPDPAAHEASQTNPVGGPDHNPLPPACSPSLPSPNAPANVLNGTQCPANKLVVIPTRPIRRGARFHVTVSYVGKPGVHTDGDGYTEGWFRAPDGGFVTTEPIGSEAWMPLNDYPAAKPTYDFVDTVDAGRTVIANGKLVSVHHHGPSGLFPNGSTTWRWHAAAPIASYLVENSVGRFSLTKRTVGGITFYRAQNLNIPAAQRAKNLKIMRMQRDITAFESRFTGPYPFTLRRHRDRDAERQLRGGDGDDDRLRRRRHRHRHSLPREHAPVVGRQRQRGRLRHDVLQGGHGDRGRDPVRRAGWPRRRREGRRPPPAGPPFRSRS